MLVRIVWLLSLLLVAWVVMTFTHETGHLIGGWCCGATLQAVDLWPWRLPYSLFEPDPLPLVTLWSGPLLGVLIPVGLAVCIRQDWMWFVAHFCTLANGLYLATAFFSDDRFLDTQRLLAHGTSPYTIGLYAVVTIGVGYVGFRREVFRVLGDPGRAESFTLGREPTLDRGAIHDHDRPNDEAAENFR